MIEIDSTMAVRSSTGSASTSATRPMTVTFSGLLLTRSAEASTLRRATISARPVSSRSSVSRTPVPISRGSAPNENGDPSNQSPGHPPEVDRKVARRSAPLP